jgi:pimeloyl-ACP methyl ester carboxylesterase
VTTVVNGTQHPDFAGVRDASEENFRQRGEGRIVAYRASEAAARLSWPMGDRGLHKRLHRIQQPTLLVWGEQDAIVPASYADRYTAGISGPTEVVIVPDAGHLCAVDQPTVTAKHVQAFLDA